MVRTGVSPSAPPVTTLSEQTYVAIEAWAKAAKAAGSISTKALLSKVAGLKINAPAGTVTFEKNHFVSMPISIVQVQADGSVKVVKAFADVQPDQTCTTPLG